MDFKIVGVTVRIGDRAEGYAIKIGKRVIRPRSTAIMEMLCSSRGVKAATVELLAIFAEAASNKTKRVGFNYSIEMEATANGVEVLQVAVQEFNGFCEGVLLAGTHSELVCWYVGPDGSFNSGVYGDGAIDAYQKRAAAYLKKAA